MTNIIEMQILMILSTPCYAYFIARCYIYSASSKWYDFLVGTMEVNHQTHRHSDGLSASGPMFIRGFPLYGYLMTVSTSAFANFFARCELFCVE